MLTWTNPCSRTRWYQQERLFVTRLAHICSEIAGLFTLVTDCIDAKDPVA
jgi:hypothetical protein